MGTAGDSLEDRGDFQWRSFFYLLGVFEWDQKILRALPKNVIFRLVRRSLISLASWAFLVCRLKLLQIIVGGFRKQWSSKKTWKLLGWTPSASRLLWGSWWWRGRSWPSRLPAARLCGFSSGSRNWCSNRVVVLHGALSFITPGETCCHFNKFL